MTVSILVPDQNGHRPLGGIYQEEYDASSFSILPPALELCLLRRRGGRAWARSLRGQSEVLQGLARLREALGRLSGEKLTPEEQKRRFIEATREAGADFNAALKQIVNAKKADVVP